MNRCGDENTPFGPFSEAITLSSHVWCCRKVADHRAGALEWHTTSQVAWTVWAAASDRLSSDQWEAGTWLGPNPVLSASRGVRVKGGQGGTTRV